MLRRILKTAHYSGKYASLLLRPPVWSRPVLADPVPPGEYAVLLIPGFLGTREVLSPLRDRYREANIRAFTFHPGLYTLFSFEIVLMKSVKCVERILNRHPDIKRLDLVGHSMGGWIMLDLLRHPIFRGLDARVLALGTPYMGTWAALLGAGFSGSARELLPIHARNRHLPDRYRVEVPFRIFAGSDDVLAPPSRCRHPDASEPTIFPVDHAGLLFDERVFLEQLHFFQSG